jgi:manganese transport protein
MAAQAPLVPASFVASNRPPSALRRYLAFGGAGALVAVGYIDPGNWATDIAGGSHFGYELLSVVLGSSVVAILFQAMSARLGIVTGKDLAVLCRESSPRSAWIMWGAAELAIVATDLAEVLGSALALQLLFGLPIGVGIVLTAVDVGILLMLERKGAKWLERAVMSLVVLIGVAFAYELLLAQPALGPLLRGMMPRVQIVRDPQRLFMAIGILGATIMPHNLYLHSSLVTTQAPVDPLRSRRERIRDATFDTVLSLGFAMLLNGALLVLAAAAFHSTGHGEVADISDAHRLLTPLLGSTLAPVVFALALLAAAQSATVTGTLAGQVVMGGFLELRWPAWKRRLVTRGCAIVPALLLIAFRGDRSVGGLLVTSQVILSIQLPFAMVPLVRLVSSRARMGSFAIGARVRVAAWFCIVVIGAANCVLIWSLVDAL